MSDIVQALRHPDNHPDCTKQLLDDAADEIERLRADNEQLRTKLELYTKTVDAEAVAYWQGQQK